MLGAFGVAGFTMLRVVFKALVLTAELLLIPEAAVALKTD